MHRVGSRENHAATWRKSQSDQTVAGDFQARVAFWRDLHDAPLTRERCRHIQISDRVESQALRASQAAEEFVYRSLGINSVYGIKARGRRAGHK